MGQSKLGQSLRESKESTEFVAEDYLIEGESDKMFLFVKQVHSGCGSGSTAAMNHYKFEILYFVL